MCQPHVCGTRCSILLPAHCWVCVLCSAAQKQLEVLQRMDPAYTSTQNVKNTTQDLQNQVLHLHASSGWVNWFASLPHANTHIGTNRHQVSGSKNLNARSCPKLRLLIDKTSFPPVLTKYILSSKEHFLKADSLKICNLLTHSLLLSHSANLSSQKYTKQVWRSYFLFCIL